MLRFTRINSLDESGADGLDLAASFGSTTDRAGWKYALQASGQLSHVNDVTPPATARAGGQQDDVTLTGVLRCVLDRHLFACYHIVGNVLSPQ